MREIVHFHDYIVLFYIYIYICIYIERERFLNSVCILITCKPVMHIALGGCLNYIYTHVCIETIYKAYNVYNQRGGVRSSPPAYKLKLNGEGAYFFSKVFLWSSFKKDFILNVGGEGGVNCTFWRTIFLCMGVKTKWTKETNHTDITRYRKPTPVCSNYECLLWCCFILSFNFPYFVAWFVHYFCFFFFWILVLLREIRTKV